MTTENKTISKTIVTDSFALIFVQCVTMLVSIAQTMILSRAFTKEEYGTYSQALMVITFIAPFLLLGLSNAINYFYNSSPELTQKKKYVQLIFGLVILLGIIGGVGILIFQQSIASYYSNPELQALLVYVAFRPLIQNLIAVYYPLYISAGMTKTVAIRNLIISFAQIAITASVALLLHSIVLIFVLLLALDIIQLFIFAILFSKRKFKFLWLPERKNFLDRKQIKRVLSYAIPLGIATMIGSITINMDKLFVGRLLSVEDFALYSNMSKELPFGFVVSSFTTVITPVIILLVTNGDKAKLTNLWADYFEIGYIATWTFCIGALICAPELLDFLYSSKYAAGLPIFIIYILVSCVRITYFGLMLTAYEKTKAIMMFSLLTVVLNFVLNLLLFHIMGMVGLAVASFISIAVSAVAQFIYGAKIANIKVAKTIKPKQMGNFILKLLLAVAVLLVAKSLFDQVIGNSWIVLIISYATFVGIMVALHGRRIKILVKRLNSLKA